MMRDAYRPAPATGNESARATAVTIPVVTRPLGYALRMAGFLAVVGIVAALLHEHASRFFLRNPPLNALILSVLGLGIWLSFRAVLSLDPAVSWIQRFHRSEPLPGDGPPALLGPLAALLRDPSGRLTLTATGMRGVLDGIDSRLDERRDTLRYLIALLIFLGLLGTFWGLLMTANSVGETIRSLNVTGSDPGEMFQTLRAGLEAPLSGMGTAFSTSLFGLASSLVLGFLDLQASHAQNRFANEAESWLSSLTRLDAGPATSGDEEAAPSYLYALLERTAERFDELRGRLDHSIDANRAVMATMRPLGERMATLTDELRARNETGADAQRETLALLRRIAGALEGGSAGVDGATREHLRNLDLAVERLIAETAHGRDHVVAELRNEIRLLARTLSVIADRGR